MQDVRTKHEAAKKDQSKKRKSTFEPTSSKIPSEKELQLNDVAKPGKGVATPFTAFTGKKPRVCSRAVPPVMESRYNLHSPSVRSRLSTPQLPDLSEHRKGPVWAFLEARFTRLLRSPPSLQRTGNSSVVTTHKTGAADHEGDQGHPQQPLQDFHSATSRGTTSNSGGADPDLGSTQTD